MFTKHLNELTFADIEDLIHVRQEKEGHHLVFKQGFDSNPDKAKIAIAKDVAGFANASGGYLIFGVTDNGEIVGVPKTFQNQPVNEWLNRVIAGQTHPPIYFPDPQPIPLPNDPELVVLVLYIPKSHLKPHMVMDNWNYQVPINDQTKDDIRLPEHVLKTLVDYEPVYRPEGEMWYRLGNFAVVFKLIHRQSGKILAAKCFTSRQPNQKKNYQLISECLSDYVSEYLVKFNYLDEELGVETDHGEELEAPILVMDWAEGITLGEYVQKCCSSEDYNALEKLIDEFNWFAFWLLSQPFAHGDLKPDNINIRPDGKPVLLDYDGMYVPAMKGQEASESGSLVYRHPAWTLNKFNKRMDDFSLIVLILELHLLLVYPQAFRNTRESLYFRQDDLSISALPKLAPLLNLMHTALPGHLLYLLEEALRHQEIGCPSLSKLLFRHLKRESLPWLVFIQGGTFEMGDVLDDRKRFDEFPVHKVTLNDYYLAKTPVTFKEYDLYCMATSNRKPEDEGWGRDNRPVINVSWYDAVQYCNWLSEQAGLQKVYITEDTTVMADWTANGYRLPTEAEWEYAARQRGQKVRFGNGKNIADPAEINFSGVPFVGMDKRIYYQMRTVPAGSLPANSLGLHEMSGNVWEWCWDLFGPYSSEDQINPTGPATGAGRVCRGASWGGNLPDSCRIAKRGAAKTADRSRYLGFRLARNS